MAPVAFDPLGVLGVGVPVEPDPLVPLDPDDPLSAFAVESLFVVVSDVDFVSLDLLSPPDFEELE